MKIIARALVVTLFVGVTTAGCKSPVNPVAPADDGTPSQPVSNTLTGTYMTDGVGLEYLLQLSVPNGGGRIDGSVTLARPCQNPDGSYGLQRFGPYAVGGTYSPGGVDAGGDQFNLVAPDADVNGESVQLLGGLSSPQQGMLDSSGKLIIGINAWSPSTVAAFQHDAAELVPVMAACRL